MTEPFDGPARGDVYLVHLGQTQGLEQGGKRPALVVSDDGYNRSAAGLVVVLPLTTRVTGIPSDVEMLPPAGGLSQRSFIRCDQIRSIATSRLFTRLGTVPPATMATVADWLRVLLAL